MISMRRDMAEPRLLRVGDAGLTPSTRVGDAWAAVAGLSDNGRRDDRERTRRLLAERPRPLHRAERPGHLTGSAFVVDETAQRTLLLFHTKLRIWVQPGGHADGDANLAAVAWREATEETGVAGLAVWPTAIDLDIHEVAPPSEDPHLHFDVRFLVMAPPGAVVAANHESEGHRWVTEAELVDLGVDDGLHRMARAGFGLARRLVD